MPFFNLQSYKKILFVIEFAVFSSQIILCVLFNKLIYNVLCNSMNSFISVILLIFFFIGLIFFCFFRLLVLSYPFFYSNLFPFYPVCCSFTFIVVPLPCILSICLFACIIWEKLRLIKLYRPFIAKRHTPTPAFPIASNNNRNNPFCCTVRDVSLCAVTPLGQIAVL